jgi:hypothetical protein
MTRIGAARKEYFSPTGHRSSKSNSVPRKGSDLLDTFGGALLALRSHNGVGLSGPFVFLASKFLLGFALFVA